MINVSLYLLTVFYQTNLARQALIQAIGYQVEFCCADIIHKTDAHNAALTDTAKGITIVLYKSVIN